MRRDQDQWSSKALVPIGRKGAEEWKFIEMGRTIDTIMKGE